MAQERKKMSPLNRFLSGYVRTLVAIYFLTFTTVVRAVINVFHCIDIGNGKKVVEEYPAVYCDSSDYNGVVYPIGVVMAIFYLCAVPVLFAYVIFSNRFALTNVNFMARWGVLTEPYHASTVVSVDKHTGARKSSLTVYWALFFALRRAALIAVAVLMQQNHRSQFAALSLLNAAFVVSHVWVWPFASKSENLFEMITLTTLCVVSTVLLLTDFPLNSSNEGATVVLGLIVYVPIGVFFVASATLWASRFLRRRARARAASLKGGVPDSREDYKAPKTGGLLRHHTRTPTVGPVRRVSSANRRRNSLAKRTGTIGGASPDSTTRQGTFNMPTLDNPSPPSSTSPEAYRTLATPSRGEDVELTSPSERAGALALPPAAVAARTDLSLSLSGNTADRPASPQPRANARAFAVSSALSAADDHQ